MPAFLAVTNTQTDQRARASRPTPSASSRRGCAMRGSSGTPTGRSGSRARLDRLDTRAVPQAARLVSREGGADRDSWRAGSPAEVFGQPGRGRRRPRARPGWRRRTWPPTWCASSRSSRARWAASTRARPASPKPSGRRSTTTTCRSAVEADAPPSRGVAGRRRGVTWAAVSLADKLDTLVGLFLAGERPTGSRDPFGLRRQAHGVIRILLDAETARPGVACGRRSARLLAQARRGLRRRGRQIGRRMRRLDGVPRRAAAVRVRDARADRRNVRAVLVGRAPRCACRSSTWRRICAALPEFARSAPFRQLATAFKRVRNIARELPADEFAAEERDGRAARVAARRSRPRLALLAARSRRAAGDRRRRRDGQRVPRGVCRGLAVRTGRGAVLQRSVRHDRRPRLRQARLRLMKRLEAVDSAAGRYFGDRGTES